MVPYTLNSTRNLFNFLARMPSQKAKRHERYHPHFRNPSRKLPIRKPSTRFHQSDFRNLTYRSPIIKIHTQIP